MIYKMCQRVYSYTEWANYKMAYLYKKCAKEYIHDQEYTK